MFAIFAVMLLAIGLGWVLRERRVPRRMLSNAVSGVILVLMLTIGIEVGANPNVVASFGSIALDALLLTSAALIGTWGVAWVVNRLIVRIKAEFKANNSRVQSGGVFGFSLLIVVVFALGVMVGLMEWIPVDVGLFSMVALYVLMALVGFSIGSDRATLTALFGQSWRVVFVPVATVVGTLLGVMLFSPLVGLGVFDQLAIGSGFGYYSLSSVLLSELRGAEIGAIALLVNVMRELSTVVFAPFIVRYFSPTALVCSGGATTIDVTMPVIIGHCGPQMIGVAVFHGVAVDLCVPILVSLFASLA